MALVVKIAGVNRNERIRMGTLAVEKTYGESWTADFETKDNDGGYYPNVGETVSIEIDGTVYFGGIVRSVERSKPNANKNPLFCVVHCTDWNHILERRLAGEYEWIGQAAGDIIEDIVTNSLDSEGIDTSLVPAGPTIENFRISYPTVAEAFKQIAELTGYNLFIDQDRKVRFQNTAASPVTNAAPFSIPVAANNIRTMKATETDEDYCNLVIGRVGKALREPQTETFTGSSPQSVFELAFPCALSPTIRLNDELQTVGIASVDTGRDWYWSEGSTEIRQDSDGVPLTGSDVLAVDYVGIEQIYVQATDLVEVSRRAAIEGSSGRYEKFLEIDQMLTRADAQAIVDAYLAAHQEIPLVTVYETSDYHEVQAKNLLPGQIQSMLLDGWAAQQYTYFVRSIRAQAVSKPDGHTYQFDYTVELVWGSLTKTLFQWFRDLGGAGSVAGQRTDGDTEWFHFFLGGCEDVAAGVAPHQIVVHTNCTLYLCSVLAVEAPDSGNFEFDIEVSSDGSTWDSVFQNGSFLLVQGDDGPQFNSNMSAAAALQKGMRMRCNVASGGGAAKASIKLAGKPIIGRVGTTLFDNSQGTGVEAIDEQTEALLVVM